MDVSANSLFETISSVEGFSLDVAADRKATYDTLLYRGRPVAEVEATIVEAQFRLPDGSTLVMLNDDEPFKEMLTLILVSPGLKVLDRVAIGGAFTPDYLTYAHPIGPDQVAFCYHALDQVVTIRRYRPWFSLRTRWLKVREAAVVRPAASPDSALTSVAGAGRPAPSLFGGLRRWSARVRQARAERGRGPRR